MLRTIDEALDCLRNWDKESVFDLKDSITFIEQHGTLLERVELGRLRRQIIQLHSLPAELRQYLNYPIWAIDKHGRVLCGVQHLEVKTIDELKRDFHHTFKGKGFNFKKDDYRES